MVRGIYVSAWQEWSQLSIVRQKIGMYKSNKKIKTLLDHKFYNVTELVSTTNQDYLLNSI